LYVNQELKFENPSGEVSVTEWKYKKMTIFTETTDLLMEVKDTLLHHLMRTGEAGPDTYKHELARLQKVFVKNKDNEELTEKDVKDLAANLKRFNAEERDEVTVKMVDPEESATCASLKTEGNEPSWFNWLREIAPCAPSWDPFSRACDHAFVCKEGSVFLDEKGDEDKNCLPFHSDKKFKSKQTVTIDKKKKTRTERITYYDKNEKTTVFDLNMEMKDGIKIDEMKDGIKIEETYTDPQKNTKTTVFDLEGNVVEKKTGTIHGKKLTVVTTDREGTEIKTEEFDLKDGEINENGDHVESNESKGNEEV